MKKTVSVMAAVVAATLILQSGSVQAGSISGINRQLNQLNNQSQAAKQQKEAAAAQKQTAQHYKNKMTQQLKVVMEQLNDVSNQLARVAVDIENVQERLRQTKRQIQEANDRIAAREKTLESRIRLMYTDGTVSYLDVLLASTNFNDFITRVDSIKTIVDQDQFLLEQHKRDKALVVQKKKELDTQYVYAKSLYAIKQGVKKQLNAKEEEKQHLIATYNQQIDDADDVSAESDQLLVQLASKRSVLIQQKNKLKAEQAARAARARAAAAKGSSRRAAAHPYAGGSGILSVPVSGARISSGFGVRVHPITGVTRMHTGVDLAAPQGTDIHAAEDGVVIVAEWWSGYGNTVVIDHGNGLWTLYGHIRNGGIKVRVGQTVKRGETIAEIGSTGNSTGPHCHFEVRENNKPVNPMNYL